MSARNTSELLYDSEAALRLVDSAIAEMRDGGNGRSAHNAAHIPGHNGDPTVAGQDGSLGLVGLSHVLARGYAEIVNVLGSLRESRSVLERATVDHLRQTHARLREVSNATETAATSILEGLERSVAMVDDLDTKAASGDAPGSAEIRSNLRDELFGLMGCMQFQDITTQQLSYASSVLTEIETRLAELATVFDPTAFGKALPSRPAAAPAPPPQMTFDPNATTENAEARQALADEVFRKEV